MSLFINRLTINFEECDPAPANGYLVTYRPVGSADPYRNGGWFPNSPAVVDDENEDPEGTQYEGFIRSDYGDYICPPQPFTTELPL